MTHPSLTHGAFHSTTLCDDGNPSATRPVASRRRRAIRLRPHSMALSDRLTLWLLGFTAAGTLGTLTLAQSVRGERNARIAALNKKLE